MVYLRKVIHMDDLLTDSNFNPQNAKQEPVLIRAAAEGDLSAFNTLVQIYQDSIFTLAYYLAPKESDAVLIAQSTVQSLHRELPGYRAEVFRIWLYKLLVKVCRETWRSEKANTSGRLLWRKNGTKSSQTNPSPAGDLVGIEGEHYGSQELILDRLHDLPFELRIAVVLVDIEGLNYEMAAKVLGKHKHEICEHLGKARRYLCQPLLDIPHSLKTGIK